MDGLLVDSEPLWHEAEVEIFGGLGLPIQRDDTRETKGMFVDEVTNHWFSRYPWEGPLPAQVASQIVDRVGELTLSHGQILPGAVETVAAMATRGPIALASSTPHRLIRVVLDHIGLLDAFEVICSAEDEGWGKPHPAVFLTAAAQLGVDARRCVVFEDSPAGVLAAKAGRMFCIAVPEDEDAAAPEIQLADVIVPSLEVLDLDRVDALVL